VRTVSAEEAGQLLAPAADDLLEIVEVSPKLNNPRNDGPEVQEAAGRTLV
jgi:putative SOS response-associated peptidase YedK